MAKNILIVEDDTFTQEFYQYIFGKVKFNSIIIDDPNLIFSSLDSKPVDLIIMDINLKNAQLNGEMTDGVKLSKFIKQQEKYAKIPIILVTAYDIALNRSNFLDESLADGYIKKPIIDLDEFLKKVNGLIER